MDRVRIEDVLSGAVRVDKPDETVYRQVKERWDNAAKPLDSLGKFEDITAKIGAIQGSVDINIENKTIIVMCADNGIVEEGISQTGQEVTLAVSKAMGRRESSVCKMAKRCGIEVMPVDIGINSDEEIPGVIQKKICHGTRNFAKEPALNRQEVLDALQVGMDCAHDAVQRGAGLLGTGEMGIGNTTTSSAVTAAILGCPVESIVGRGSGLNDAGLERKRKVIDEAIRNHNLKNADALTVLETVGGLDIAGMAGVMIGGAVYKVPVVIDGAVSCAAALLAVKLNPAVKNYLIASHVSKEPSAREVLKELGLEAVINADMALGEGTGAVMMCSLLDTALTLYTKQLTFDDIEIDRYERLI